MTQKTTKPVKENIENVGTGDRPVRAAAARPAVDKAEVSRIKGVSPEDTKQLQERAAAGLSLTDAEAEAPFDTVTGPGEKE